jgi:hypothetical protein
MFKDQLMINRNNLSGEISFGCIMCDESDDIVAIAVKNQVLMAWAIEQ